MNDANHSKRIAVLGATGAQGGALARAIFDHPEGGFTVRALTRNPSSDAALALAARGAEVVQADLDDVDSLASAFEGCHGVFGVTAFWEIFSAERETAQAGNIAEAAKRAGVAHVVWSTLEDTRERVPVEDDRMPTLMERYKVPHFDSKGEADALFREKGVPTTFLRTSFYWENFIYFGMGPRRGEDGVLELVLPLADKKLPGISAEDIGRSAYGVFEAGEALIGETIGVAGEHLSGADMAAALMDALGEEVRYVPVPPDVYRSFGFPGAEDLGNMFQYKVDFEEEFRAQRPVDASRALNPRLQDFRSWLEHAAEKIPLA